MIIHFGSNLVWIIFAIKSNITFTGSVLTRLNKHINFFKIICLC
eukprot:UN06001